MRLPMTSVTGPAALAERVAEVTLDRRRDVGDQLIGNQRLVDPPPLTGLLDRLGRDVRVTREDPFR